ncbi:MAG: CYTH domain-containing protein [archaeon]
MKYECQYKFPITDKSAFILRLKSKNITLTAPSDHKYTYFEPASRDGAAHTFIRIKESQGKSAIDMKTRDEEDSWKSFESRIDNPGEMKSILGGIGCKEVFAFHKRRQTFINEFIRIDVDTIDKIGTFLEAKFASRDKERVEQFLSGVGINVDKYDNRSIVEIFLSKEQGNL